MTAVTSPDDPILFTRLLLSSLDRREGDLLFRCAAKKADFPRQKEGARNDSGKSGRLFLAFSEWPDRTAGAPASPLRSRAGPAKPVEARSRCYRSADRSRARPAHVLSLDSGACRPPGVSLMPTCEPTLHEHRTMPAAIPSVPVGRNCLRPVVRPRHLHSR